METILRPTTRRLHFGHLEYNFAGNVLIETDKPRLELGEHGHGPHVGQKPYCELRFTAQNEQDRDVLEASTTKPAGKGASARGPITGRSSSASTSCSASSPGSSRPTSSA
jgi:hypothetical protein